MYMCMASVGRGRGQRGWYSTGGREGGSPVTGSAIQACVSISTDFSNNRFDHVPREVCDFSALVKLNFYCNSLRTVPDDLRHLANLRDLSLR